MKRFNYAFRISLCFVFICVIHSSFAIIINVPADYPTIQAAIDAATNGDEIIVAPGIYYENIAIGGKNITLRSTDPTSSTVVATTIIDGHSSGSVVTFSGTEATTCILSGFTITNGYATEGSGIHGNGSIATIQYNTIMANTAYEDPWYGNGGGLLDCDGKIQNNTISDNLAENVGGGLVDCDGMIKNNLISDNTAEYAAGGLYRCDNIISNNVISGNVAISNVGGGLFGCNGTIKDNLISYNSALHGGGLRQCDGLVLNNVISNNTANRGGGLNDCEAIIQYNIIYNNRANEHGGGLRYCEKVVQNNVIYQNSALYGGGLSECNGVVQNNTIFANSAEVYGGGLSSCSGSIDNCIIWQNSAPSGAQLIYCSSPSYSCIQDWGGTGSGNISDSPQLVDPDNGDFHLQPSSPCIDAGSYIAELTKDFEGDPRPYDGTPKPRGDGSDYDIGADEYYLLPSFDFETGPQGWTFRTPSPTEVHLSHWDNATLIISASAIGINTPFDESTNYFALWDSLDAETIPCYDSSLYQIDWLFSTNRGTTNALPSLRFRIGLNNQKAFAYSRVYPGDWLPLAQSPDYTTYTLFFEPPIEADGLFLAFSLIDWTDDFRGSSPAGEVYLEEVSVYRSDLPSFAQWQNISSLSGTDFVSWAESSATGYDSPTHTRETDNSLTLSSGINADLVFGSWDSPTSLFTFEPDKLYRLTTHLSSNPQLGGPELRLRVHTDDFRYSWYTYYLSSYTPGESALPPEAGADYPLYLTLPFSTQPCHMSFDLIDFSSSFGGTLTLHNLSLHSHLF